MKNDKGFTCTQNFGVNSQGERGFIGRIILLIIAIIALKYFLDFDLIAYLKSPEFQNKIQPIIDFLTKIYNWLDTVVRTIVGK